MAIRQDIRFCTSRDGVRLAVARSGRGPALLRAAHWLSHVRHDVESPVWRPWIEALSEGATFIRYDQRGSGLSDRDVATFTLDDWVADLEAVADAECPGRFALLGMSQGGAVAVRYILRNPGRVSRLVLMGAYARGGLRRGGGPRERLEAETLVNLVRLGWGGESLAFREVFTNRFIPGGTARQHRWWSDLQRLTAVPETAARSLEAFQRIDVTEEVARIDVPTLVFHATRDACVPFEEGRLLAGLIPGARFVALDSDNHVLLPEEPAWPHFLSELRAFLGLEEGGAGEGALTPAEAAVYDLLAGGLSNRAIAGRLGKSEKTVRNQLSAIFAKLGVKSRAEAIVRARGG